MANNFAMDSLKGKAIRVYDGMMVVYPWSSKEESLNISELAPKFNGCYAANNSTVCFLTENQIFVTPYTREGMRILCSEGFRRENFYVPFSNGDYPKAEQFKWNALREMAHRSYELDFIADCEAYCDKHHIGEISKETLERCFMMPRTGVKVKHFYYESVYYPIMNEGFLDCHCDNLGHYCTNNGRVVFVYRDGHTYVAKGYKILSELRAAGYTEKGLFVPFSNSEQIQDPVLRARWESIA